MEEENQEENQELFWRKKYYSAAKTGDVRNRLNYVVPMKANSKFAASLNATNLKLLIPKQSAQLIGFIINLQHILQNEFRAMPQYILYK